MRVCSIHKHAYEFFGRIGEKEVKTSIADIESLDNAAELIDFFDDSIEVHQGLGHLKIQLYVGTFRLAPVSKFTSSEEGHPEWETVTSLRLDEILQDSND